MNTETKKTSTTSEEASVDFGAEILDKIKNMESNFYNFVKEVLEEPQIFGDPNTPEGREKIASGFAAVHKKVLKELSLTTLTALHSKLDGLTKPKTPSKTMAEKFKSFWN